MNKDQEDFLAEIKKQDIIVKHRAKVMRILLLLNVFGIVIGFLLSTR